ncbi:MAG TPA: PIG-L family deacetylase [Candidatus Didemnitutus sp.]|nr:PIG-L family deacetylase [Candidatus Didemnitutus sp.]
MSRLLLAQSRPLPVLSGPVVIIAPHADDETLGCGQLLWTLSRRQHPVTVAFVTDSAAPHATNQGRSRQDTADRRREEALSALQTFGLDTACARFLDAPDGRMDHLASHELELLRHGFAELLEITAPMHVFTPLLGDGSSEHDATTWLVREAVAGARRPITRWEYAVWAWWDSRRLSRQLGRPAENFSLAEPEGVQAKRAAMQAHRSQILPETNPPLPSDLREACCGPAEFHFCRP